MALVIPLRSAPGRKGILFPEGRRQPWQDSWKKPGLKDDGKGGVLAIACKGKPGRVIRWPGAAEGRLSGGRGGCTPPQCRQHCARQRFRPLFQDGAHIELDCAELARVAVACEHWAEAREQ